MTSVNDDNPYAVPIVALHDNSLVHPSEYPMLGGGLVCHPRLRSSCSLLNLPVAAGLIRAACTVEPVRRQRQQKPPVLRTPCARQVRRL